MASAAISRSSAVVTSSTSCIVAARSSLAVKPSYMRCAPGFCAITSSENSAVRSCTRTRLRASPSALWVVEGFGW